jgi:hypothetical protein
MVVVPLLMHLEWSGGAERSGEEAGLNGDVEGT